MKPDFSLEDIKAAFKVVTPLSVRYADLDTVGHVNNASYLSYFEEARIDYFEKVTGFEKTTLEFGVVVAHLSIDYMAQIVLGDKINVYTRCTRIGNSSFNLESVFVTNDSQISARAKCVLVSIDRSGKSVPIHPDTREKMEEFEK